jgi:hypothetical protein
VKPKENPEFDRFTSLVDAVLAVPRTVILERDREYKRQVDANPNRRGPKRKAVKPSSVHGPGDSVR